MLLGAAVALVQVGVALLVLLGALAALNLRLKGQGLLGVRAPSRQVVRLSAEHALHVVEIDGRRLLVGTGPGGAPRLVTELEAAPAGEATALGAAPEARRVA